MLGALNDVVRNAHPSQVGVDALAKHSDETPEELPLVAVNVSHPVDFELVGVALRRKARRQPLRPPHAFPLLSQLLQQLRRIQIPVPSPPLNIVGRVCKRTS